MCSIFTETPHCVPYAAYAKNRVSAAGFTLCVLSAELLGSGGV
jgi:hypothetical protein